MKFLLVGFFRSGTTLLSNSINSHPKLHCVVDPMMIFVKLIRNKIFKYDYKRWDEDLENHIELKKKNFKSKIKNINLKTHISKKSINFFHNKLVREKVYQHPNISKIKNFTGTRGFKNVFNYYLREIKKLSKTKKKILGTKMSWCEEYLELFQKDFKNLKVVYIYRNIEDTINSALNSKSYKNEVPHAVRPILYYIIYWKKSLLYTKNNKKILTIKYEDLIKDFDLVINEVFCYLKVKKFKIKNFNDQYGNSWKNNSSFKKLTFSKTLILKKKRRKLNQDLSNVINYLCEAELKELGYVTKHLKYTNKNIIKILKKYENKLDFDKKYHKYFDYKKILTELM